MFRGLKSIFFLLISALATKAYALEKADVLPQGVTHAGLRVGTISGFGDKFHSNGLLTSMGDNYSRTFDSKTVVSMFPEYRAAVDALKQFGRYRFDQLINFGTLKIEAEPKVQFNCALLAHGFSRYFTMVFAVPVVRYEANANVYQTPSNVRQILDSLPSELREKVSKIPTNVVAGFHSTLRTAGYSSFSRRDMTYVADAQILGLYRYHESPFWNGVVKTVINLPTGPKDDPDDLLDLPLFGQTSVGIHFLQDMHVLKNVVVGAYAGHTLKIPDRIVKRVPVDDEDLLPDASRKEDLARDLGDVTTGGLNARYSPWDSIEFGTGLEVGFKGPDHYSGSNSWNYSLLSKNSNSEWRKLQLSAEFSTTDWYLKGMYPIPFAIAYEFGDIFSGINVERQVSHEITFKAYF